MTLELALIIGFILHFIGDYILQNDYMAQNKTGAFIPAFIHALVYSLPFLYLSPSVYWLILLITHFLIDRYRLAVYWIKFINWNWSSTNFGYDNEKPKFISFWLLVITDNTFHILFNSLTIYLHHQ